MPCETKRKISKGKTKAKLTKRKKTKWNNTKLNHKAVLKSIRISTVYLFSKNQTKLKVCFTLEKNKTKKCKP